LISLGNLKGKGGQLWQPCIRNHALSEECKIAGTIGKVGRSF
jgi:hypothetical protein